MYKTNQRLQKEKYNEYQMKTRYKRQFKVLKHCVIKDENKNNIFDNYRKFIKKTRSILKQINNEDKI